MRILIAALVLLPGAAFAQPEPLRPAPVPGIARSDGPPADRAGTASTPQSGAPFSGLPSGGSLSTGQPTPPTLTSPTRDSSPSPNLSK